MRLIHKHWHGVGNSPPQCNTPTGEGAGGDDFDGEEDDGDKAEGTTPEETSGTDADGQQSGDRTEAEAPEVIYVLQKSWLEFTPPASTIVLYV